MRRIALLVSLLMGAAASGLAQTGTTNGEWRAYGGDAGSTRYAPLDQIARDNVGDLEIAADDFILNFGLMCDLQALCHVVEGARQKTHLII